MTDYAALLATGLWGSQWSLSGNTYEGLTWLSDSPKPSQAELDALWPQVQHDREVARIRDERHRRYLAETDPLFMKAQRDEEDGVTMADWKAAVAAIKTELPYPPAP